MYRSVFFRSRLGVECEAKDRIHRVFMVVQINLSRNSFLSTLSPCHLRIIPASPNKQGSDKDSLDVSGRNPHRRQGLQCLIHFLVSLCVRVKCSLNPCRPGWRGDQDKPDKAHDKCYSQRLLLFSSHRTSSSRSYSSAVASNTAAQSINKVAC